MEIKFLKKEDDKHVLVCSRKDRTSTWIHLDAFFLHHDLVHYAVETTLQFKSAFYGMIAKGISITDFELSKDQRNIELSDEALYAENIVNLIMMESYQGKLDNFNATLHESLQQNKFFLNPVFVADEQLQAIHNAYLHLTQQWNKLQKGESITFHFEE